MYHGRMTDKEATVRMRVSLRDEMVARLKKQAEATGRSIEQVIEETLVSYYKRLDEAQSAAESDHG